MPRPRAGLLSRTGIPAYLRGLRGRQSPADSDALKDSLTRDIARATKALRAEIREVREREHDLRREVRLLHAVIAANGTRPLARHRQALQFGEVAAHLTRAVETAALEHEPTPHLVINGLLPEPTYEALLDAIPPDECFSARDPVKQNFRLTPGKIVPDLTAAVWTFIEQEVIPAALVPALIARFHPYVDKTYRERYNERGPAAAALPHEPTAGRLMLRRPGYHLDPHLDPQRVIVTCLLYLARPGDSPEHGTQFFALDRVPTVTGSKTFYPAEAGLTSTLVTTVPFRPNTAVAFLNAGAAAHGATIPESAPATTRRYAYQFYVSPSPSSLAAVTGDTVDETPV